MSSERDAAGASAEPAALLARFAPGCPAYLAVGEGWFGLLEDLDAELAVLEPGYRLRQVKEKFGGLRVYYELPSSRPDCCAERFGEGEDARRCPEGHAVAVAARAVSAARFAVLVADAERRSFRVCDVCAAPGELRSAGGWLSTRCPVHAR